MDGIDLVTKTPDMGFAVPGVTSGNMPPVLQDPQYQAATKRLGELREKETKLTQEKADWQRKKDPELTRLEEMQTATEKELKAPPQYTPDKIDPADAVVWGLVAALGGLATRNPAMNAMNALSAAAMAHQKGHAEQFEQAVKAYHEQADYALKKGESIQRQYQAILKDRQLTLEGKQAELEALGSQINLTDKARGDIEKIYDQFQKHQQQLKNAQVADAKLRAALDKQSEGLRPKIAELFKDKSGYVWRLDPSTQRFTRTDDKGQQLVATPEEAKVLTKVTGQRSQASVLGEMAIGRMNDALKIATEELSASMKKGLEEARKVPELDGHTLTGAAKRALLAKWTPQQDATYTAMYASLGAAFQTLGSWGRAGSNALREEYSKLAAQPGDTYLTKLSKLASMRLIVEAAANSISLSQLASPEQISFAKQMEARIQKAIPFTVDDVATFVAQGQDAESLDQFMQRSRPEADEYNRKVESLSVPQASGVEQSVMQPSQTAQPSTEIAQPKSKAEFDALPSGTVFIDPNGTKRTKP